MTTDDAAMRPGLALVLGAFVVLALGGLVTTWDGAWFVARLLDTGTPTFLHGRLLGWLTQAPAVNARWFGADAGAVTLLLGIGMAMVPIGAVLATWHIAGADRRPMLVWPVLGITVAALPGLAFVVSEAFLAICLGWPIVVAAALGRLGRHRVLVAVLVACLAVSHPFAVPMLVVAAIAAAVAAVGRRAAGGTVDRPDARPVLVLAAIAGLVALRYVVLPSPYEADTLSLARLGDHLRGGVAGRPILAVALSWTLGAWLLIRPRDDRGGVLVVGGLVAALLLVLVPWAMDVARWERALMFRTWVLAAQVPLLGMLIVAAVRPLPSRRNVHGLVVAGAGAVAITVLLAQSIAWRAAREDLSRALEGRPAGCIELDSTGLAGSVLDHWGVTALVLLAEAPRPRHLVLVDTECLTIDAASGVPLKVVDGVVIERLSRDAWFELDELAAALAAGP